MKHRFSWPVLLLAAIVLVSSLYGCRENSVINAAISPNDSTLGIYSTELGCITHTYYDDTGVSGLFINGYSVFTGAGSIDDDFFGTMNGATYFQVIPDQPTNAVFDNTTIDSAALILPYSGFTYGDTTDQNATQTYQAFFMGEQLAANTLYYSYENKNVETGNPLSDPYTVNVYRLGDSVKVKDKNYAPALRIPLNLTVLLSKLTPALQAAQANPDNPYATFKNVLNGLVVKVADGAAPSHAYPFFQLDGKTPYTTAGIVVYYHANGSTSDTAVQHYYFNGESCGYFNKVSRSYASAPINALLTSTNANDSLIGIQNQPGPCIDVVIPGLRSLPGGVINKATLQLSLLPQHDNKYGALTRIYPKVVSNGTYPSGTSAGGVYEVADRYPLTSTSPLQMLNGQLNEISRDGNKLYAFTIGLPREIMRCRAENNDTLHLRLNGTQDLVGAFRAVLAGGNHPNPLYKARLIVVYSTLN